MKKFLAVIAALLTLAVSTGCAKTADYARSSSLPTVTAEIPDDLYDYTAAINGKAVQFPLTYTEFQKCGLTLKSNEVHATLESGQYALFAVNDGKNETAAFFANFSDKKKKAADCAVCGVQISESDGVSLQLAQGIALGRTDKATVEKAYGTPTSRKSENGTVVLTYGDTDGAELSFKGGRLTEISYKRIADPRYADSSDSEPEAVSAYKKPKDLSKKLSSMSFYLYGEVYKFPTPVKTLINDGWVLAAKECEYVPSGETVKNAVKLTRANSTITLGVKNTADYATTVENCFITGIKSSYSQRLDLTLYGGCRVGAAKSTLLAAYPEKSFTAITTKKNKTIYTYCANDGAQLEITVNNDNGYITKIQFSMQ